MSHREERPSLSLYDELIRLRDRQRQVKKSATLVVRGEQLPWEINPQGKMRWYLHPSIRDTAVQTLMLFLQELPPGSFSGKQKCQGGAMVYVLEGKGHTVIDEVAYPWQADDVVQLPIRPDGITFQHFNDDPSQAARLICAEPNLAHVLGVDAGTSFEQLSESGNLKGKAEYSREAPEITKGERAEDREAVPSEETSYDREVRLLRDQLKRCYEGKVVVKGKERPLERTRQGWLRFYLHNLMIQDTALKDWRIFVHEIHTHSGKHIHQGGLVIFVLDGAGYTIVDGQKLEWKGGDLILLPIKPGGVEHQHFNLDPDKPVRWLAVIYAPFQDALAHFLDQKEESPDHKAASS